MKARLRLIDCVAVALPLVALATAVALPAGQGQTAAPAPRELPARTLPVPDTTSSESQRAGAGAIPANWSTIPKTDEEWAAAAGRGGGAPGGIGPGNQMLLDRFGVKSEETTVKGVRASL